MGGHGPDFGMLLTDGNYSCGSYRYGFNGQEKDDEIYGTGNSMTSMFWQYDARLGRRWNVDTVDRVYEGSYTVLSNSPIIGVDPNGDSTMYYFKGELIYTSYDGLDDAVVDISEDNIDEWQRNHNLVENYGNWGDVDNDDDDVNKTQRKLGTVYELEQFEDFYDENNDDMSEDYPAYVNEHGSYLYEEDGHVRVGNKNIRGRPGDVILIGFDKDKDVSTGKVGPQENNPVGRIHTHPNVGKPALNNSMATYISAPTGDIVYRNPFSANHYEVAVAPKNIWFFHKPGHSIDGDFMIKVPRSAPNVRRFDKKNDSKRNTQ